MACLLCRFLCHHGCSVSAVATALAFHPPDPPSYTLRRRSVHPTAAALSAPTQPYEWVLDDSVEPVPWPLIEITEVRTRLRHKVPVFTFRYPGAHYTMILCHGNATDCGLMRSTCIDLCVNLRVNVVCFDYTGYGPSAATESASEAHTHSDVEAVYDYILRSQLCRAPDQIILYGQSIGSGPAVYCASRHPARALILHAGIASGLRVILPACCCGGACGTCWWCAAAARPCDMYPNVSRLRKMKVDRVFVMHGQRDEEVSVEHGLALWESLPARLKPLAPTAATDAASGASKGGAAQQHERVSATAVVGASAASAAGKGGGSSAFATAFDPWYPPAAAHNDLHVLYRQEYILRLRAFIVSLQPDGLDYISDPIIQMHALPRMVGVLSSLDTAPEAPGVPGSMRRQPSSSSITSITSGGSGASSGASREAGASPIARRKSAVIAAAIAASTTGTGTGSGSGGGSSSAGESLPTPTTAHPPPVPPVHEATELAAYALHRPMRAASRSGSSSAGAAVAAAAAATVPAPAAAPAPHLSTSPATADADAIAASAAAAIQSSWTRGSGSFSGPAAEALDRDRDRRDSGALALARASASSLSSRRSSGGRPARPTSRAHGRTNSSSGVWGAHATDGYDGDADGNGYSGGYSGGGGGAGDSDSDEEGEKVTVAVHRRSGSSNISTSPPPVVLPVGKGVRLSFTDSGVTATAGGTSSRRPGGSGTATTAPARNSPSALPPHHHPHHHHAAASSGLASSPGLQSPLSGIDGGTGVPALATGAGGGGGGGLGSSGGGSGGTTATTSAATAPLAGSSKEGPTAYYVNRMAGVNRT